MRNPYNTNYVGRCGGCQDHIDDIEPRVEWWMFIKLLGRTVKFQAHNDIKCIANAIGAEYREEKTKQCCSGCQLEVLPEHGGHWVYQDRGEYVLHDDIECFNKALSVEKIDGILTKAAGW